MKQELMVSLILLSVLSFGCTTAQRTDLATKAIDQVGKYLDKKLVTLEEKFLESLKKAAEEAESRANKAFAGAGTLAAGLVGKYLYGTGRKTKEDDIKEDLATIKGKLPSGTPS